MATKNGASIAKPGFFAALVVLLDRDTVNKPLKLGVSGATIISKRTYTPKDPTRRVSKHVMLWISDNHYTWKELSDHLRALPITVISTFRWKLCDNDVYQAKLAEKRKEEREDEEHSTKKRREEEKSSETTTV